MKTIKIALSASFWNVPACKALLVLCDRIYTSNAGAYGELQEVFGADKIKVMTDAMPSTIKWVRQKEIEMAPDDNVSFVTYSDLHKISTCYDARMEDKDKEIAVLKAELAAVLKTDLPVLLDAENYKRLFEDRDACLTQRDRTIDILMRDVRQLKDALTIRDYRVAHYVKIVELHSGQHDRDIARVRDLEATLEAKDRELKRLTDMTESSTMAEDQDRTINHLNDTLQDRDAEINVISNVNHLLVEDQRRLNYLIKMGEYWPSTHDSPAFNVWTITTAAGVPFRVHLDKLREGLKYDKDNVPISPHGGPAWAADEKEEYVRSLDEVAKEQEITKCLKAANAELDFLQSLQSKPEIPQALDTSIKHWESLARDPMDQDHSV